MCYSVSHRSAAPCTKPHSDPPPPVTRALKKKKSKKLLVLLEGRNQSSSLTREDLLEPFRLKDGLSTNCCAPDPLYLPMSSYTEVKTTQTVATQRISTALGNRKRATEFWLRRHCFPDTHQHPHPLATLIHQRVQTEAQLGHTNPDPLGTEGNTLIAHPSNLQPLKGMDMCRGLLSYLQYYAGGLIVIYHLVNDWLEEVFITFGEKGRLVMALEQKDQQMSGEREMAGNTYFGHQCHLVEAH